MEKKNLTEASMTKYLWIFVSFVVLFSGCADRERCRDCAKEQFAPQPGGELPCCEDADY